MWWKLALAYLSALPAVLWIIYRSGEALSESHHPVSRRDAPGWGRR
jgi:hypothetical protein